MNKIILTTLNARYIHSSIGLRYLFANLKELQSETAIKEFVINENITDIAERILAEQPEIIGISVYIWNALDVQRLVSIIKKVSPATKIILGGPEVSHQPLRVDFGNADYIICGEGELEFYSLCKKLLNNSPEPLKTIAAGRVPIDKLELPYKYYSVHDIKNRVIYVEASRGCPFECSFCLSSIDKTVRYFDVETLLNEFEILWQRGARHFKFIDRSFNLNIDKAIKILDFFLQKVPPYLLHFEVIPEHFPELIKEKLKLFPPASLQLEIGIQTLDPEIAGRINRKFDFKKIKENLRFLGEETSAHMHVDLIAGLPGETLSGFAQNLNTLVCITSSEIQLGVLKKLSGTAISQQDEKYGMIYSDIPPYEILQNNLITFNEMQKLKRLTRFWDMVYNSGNFGTTSRLLWEGKNVFEGFAAFSDWLYSETESTWQISLNRLAELILKYLTEIKNFDRTEIAEKLVRDILKINGRKLPPFLREYSSAASVLKKNELQNINKRQIKHL